MLDRSLICSISQSQKWFICLFVYACASCCRLRSFIQMGSLFVAVAVLSFKRVFLIFSTFTLLFRILLLENVKDVRAKFSNR